MSCSRLTRPYLAGLPFSRSLTVLDRAVGIEAAWATRVRGTFAISTAAHEITQQWVHAIVDTFGDLEGVRYNSRLAGDPCLTLFMAAHPAMPMRPVVLAVDPT